MELIKSKYEPQLIKSIILIEKGLSIEKVSKTISDDIPGISESDIKLIIDEALQEISDNQFTSPDHLISIHTCRYNEQIRSLLSVPDPEDMSKESVAKLTPNKFNLLRLRKIKSCTELLDVLKQKEELLQLHNSNLSIEINSNHTIKYAKKRPEVNFEKLTLEELIELLVLLKKARGNAKVEIPSVVQGVKNEIEKLDLVSDNEVELLEEPLNINAIRLEAPKEVEEEKYPVQNIEKQLQNSFLIQAAMSFQNAGMTLTDEEKRLIKK